MKGSHLKTFIVTYKFVHVYRHSCHTQHRRYYYFFNTFGYIILGRQECDMSFEI